MYWDATYRVTTPLFLGGANPETDAELRPSTLKGLLRFWFRAIALSRLHEYSEVKNLENDIFGSTEKQSSFLLTIDQQEELSKINSGDNWQGYPGLRYLGYGVVDRNGKTTRPHLKPGGCFTVRLRAKKEAPKEAAFFLPLTLQALGLFGAAGSRSRNGFGSLSLESLTCNDEEIWKAPTTLEELKKCQKTLLNNIKLSKNNDSLPEYTAFSN
ncbi:MAG: type III-B CRISPR module RAMP protein Cmr1, partial [Dethiobacteria bacterium]